MYQVLDSLANSILGVSLGTVISFGRRGLKLYGTTNITIALVVLAVLILLKVLGLLNPGNLPKYGRVEKKPNSPLKGKRILFLGSSVTKGFAAQGRSFVDMVAESTGAICTKEAVSGTTLVENGEKSYVARLKKLDKKAPYDLFVCQLSTNDATKNCPLGAVSAGTELSSFNTKTVCGAIEYIIAYAKETWNCPVVFYTSPYYPSVNYQAMVEVLDKIAQKWGIQIIDLWRDPEISAKRGGCMNDSIHPTKKGYQRWNPVFVQGLEAVASGKIVPASKGSIPAVAETKKKQSGKFIGSVLKYALAIVLAIVIGGGYSGWLTLSSTTGMAKPGNNDKYNPENLTPHTDSPLKDRTILFVGSSVTLGKASQGVSFVDYIERLDSANVIKEVASATTVANINMSYAVAENSYNPRLRKYDASTPVDAVVIQLSSNDATSGAPLGEISNTFDLNEIDDSTFVGGMESLIAYAKETWDCPVIVYANPEFRVKSFYDANAYYGMVQKCAEVTDKWGVDYLNMWDDPEFKAASLKDYKFWMSDPVHPTKAGYLEWWTPAFEEVLYKHFQ